MYFVVILEKEFSLDGLLNRVARSQGEVDLKKQAGALQSRAVCAGRRRAPSSV